MPILSILFIGFKIWMLVDAIRREAPFYWFLIIVFVPFGAWIYFFMVKISDFDVRPVQSSFSSRKPSLKQLRYDYERNQSISNKILLARALCEKGEFGEAGGLFGEVLSFDSENKEALHGLGRCNAGRKNYEKAVEYLRKVIEMEKSFEDYEPWFDLVTALWDSGRTEETVALLRELVTLSPRIRHETSLAEYLIKTGGREEAKRLLTGIVEDYRHEPSYVRKANRKWINRAKQLLREVG